MIKVFNINLNLNLKQKEVLQETADNDSCIDNKRYYVDRSSNAHNRLFMITIFFLHMTMLIERE